MGVMDMSALQGCAVCPNKVVSNFHSTHVLYYNFGEG